MTSKATIEALLAAATRVAGDQDRREARVAARVAWVKERIAALKAAQQRADEAWERIVDALPDDVDDDELEASPPPPEQAELDAILAEIEAVRDHDRWPRKLHWGDV
jgi:hypothetical protein